MVDRRNTLGSFFSIADFGAFLAMLVLLGAALLTKDPRINQVKRDPIKITLQRSPGETAIEVCKRAQMPSAFCNSENGEVDGNSAVGKIDPDAIGLSDERD